MRVTRLTLAIGLGLASTAQARPDEASFQEAAAGIIELAEAAQSVPGASPALAVVVVRGSGEPIIWVDGKIEANGTAPALPDTPFYIASMTKAYVGLLAVELDRKGILPLDTTLAEIWPGIDLPNVPQAGAVTMRELLSHRVPFRVPTLNYRTAYIDDVPAADYRALMEAYSEPHDPGFSYSNIGYLIYGAAASLRTGRHWRDLLKEHVLRPLRLSCTSPVISDFAPGTVTLGHQWLLDGFHPVGKEDALMHAAGGLVASPRDMALWLQAWLRRQDEAVPPASFSLAATPHSFGSESFEGIHCSGYAIGWHTCEISGATVRLHGGGYPGVRAAMAWSSDLDAGIAILSNSDSMTGGLSARLLRFFFESMVDAAFIPPRPADFAPVYAEMVRTLAADRKSAVAKSRALPEWQSWSWEPGEAELRSIGGEYSNPRLGRLLVTYERRALNARLGALDLRLEPAATNVFAAVESPVDPPAPLRIETNPDGRPIAIRWNEERFVRTGR